MLLSRSKKRYSSPNQNGFVLLTTVFLLPLLVAAGICFYFLVHILILQNETRQICRDALLRGQAGVVIPLRILLAQNPRAYFLEAKLGEARVQLAAAIAAGNPAGAALAAAKIKKVIAEQILLKNRQQKYIQLAQKNMDTGFGLARRDVETALKNRTNSQFSSFWKFQPSPLQPAQPSVLAIMPAFSSVAPAYLLKPNFTQAQELKLTWTYAISLRSELWTGKSGVWFGSRSQSRFQYHDSCSASLEGGIGQWQPTLTKGRL